jgi:mRNA interferase YafQ
MLYNISATKQFEKDVKLAKKRGLDVEQLNTVVFKLATGEVLPEKYKDHNLKGQFKGKRECHIHSDWLLVYQKQDTIQLLKLIRTGKHSDLFE